MDIIYSLRLSLMLFFFVYRLLCWYLFLVWCFIFWFCIWCFIRYVYVIWYCGKVWYLFYGVYRFFYWVLLGIIGFLFFKKIYGIGLFKFKKWWVWWGLCFMECSDVFYFFYLYSFCCFVGEYSWKDVNFVWWFRYFYWFCNFYFFVMFWFIWIIWICKVKWRGVFSEKNYLIVMFNLWFKKCF